MSFNIIDTLILAILALSLVSGMYKGFIASGLTAVGCAAAFFGSRSEERRVGKEC